MEKRDRIILAVSELLLAIEAIILIISILAQPQSDTYLRTLGIIIIITLIPAIYGFIMLARSRRR